MAKSADEYSRKLDHLDSTSGNKVLQVTGGTVLYFASFFDFQENLNVKTRYYSLDNYSREIHIYIYTKL